MNKFQSIIDAIADVVFVHHPVTGKIEFINETCTQFFGYSAKELTKKGLQLIVANDEFNFKKQLELIGKAAKGEVLTFEWKTKKRSGETFWVEVVLKRATVDERIKVIATVRDIRPRKKAIRALEERELLLASINKNISEGLYRSHSRGGLIYANYAFAKMFGYDSAEDILSVKSIDLYVKSKDRKGLTPSIIEEGFRSNIETHFKRKDGSTFWGLNSFLLTKDNEGNDIFDGAVRDITEERESKRKIEESQRILQSINQNISEGIYRSYSKGGLIYANDAFAKMFGYENVEEILRVKSLDLYATTTGRKELTDKVIEHGSRSNLETSFKRKDGSTFWGLNSAILTKDHEGNEIFDGAVRDITNEKKAAEELEALNEELLERNFELDQLVYKTSHDLRSPLRSVLGLTNLMKVESPAQIEYFDRIEERILKMDEFIKSMLNYSRANRLDLMNEDVHFPDIIAACITDLEYLDGFKEFNIIEIYDGDFSKLKVDKLRLSIVFSNIISNAFKYRNTNSHDSYLKISISYKYGSLLILFEDNGIGIDQKYLEQVFDMFFRATEKSEGSGLGMYIVKQAVEKLKGSVSVSSELNKGTLIRVEIPSY